TRRVQLFPYTPLFRSLITFEGNGLVIRLGAERAAIRSSQRTHDGSPTDHNTRTPLQCQCRYTAQQCDSKRAAGRNQTTIQINHRSEEHTSELQSREKL